MKPLVFISLLSLLLGLNACHSGSASMSRASGRAYEIVVVMDKAAWDGSVGAAVRDDITSSVPFLPQSEPSMNIMYARPDQFDGILLNVRNILIVNVDKSQYTKVSLHKTTDKWANGQFVINLTAPDEATIEMYLNDNPRILVDQYTNEEMKRARAYLQTSYSTVIMEKVQARYGIALYAPNDIRSVKETTHGLWFSNDKRDHTDVVVYSFPFDDPNTFTLEYLVAKRDSVLKYLIPGSFQGTYMSTEKRFVDYSATTLNGKYCGVLRGLWRMEGGDMMGGPFVSYARVDEQNKRVIVTEGFVFEPHKDKRNDIRRLEAALQTVSFPNEQTTVKREDL